MKIYNTISPSVEGVISNDLLYFEGVNRPSIIFTIRDQGFVSDDNIDILEKYFNDIYNLFLRKLSSFAMFEQTNDEESTKLQALLQELIKVKKLIESVKVDDRLQSTFCAHIKNRNNCLIFRKEFNIR
jgi:hypothetical protein